MRVLEARFHPWKKAGGPFLVVGRVVYRRRDVSIEPSSAGLHERPSPHEATMLQKLAYLVGDGGPGSFQRLRRLRSDFWSFVETGKGEDQ